MTWPGDNRDGRDWRQHPRGAGSFGGPPAGPARRGESWPAGPQPRRGAQPIPPTRRLPGAGQPSPPGGGRRPGDPRGRGAGGWPGNNRSGAPHRNPYGDGHRDGYRGPGTGVPPEQPEETRPHSSLRRAVTAVAAVVSVLLLAVTAGGWAVLRHYEGKVNHIELALDDSADRPPAAGRGTQNILLVGSDTREGTEGEFGQTEGQRSDTTILAHLDADGSTTLLSFPRDLWVEIPAYTDSSGTRHEPQKAKLNAAFAFGGPTLLVRTIERLTGIRIDHYLEIDFVGFQGMTDALGGVTVCVKELPPEFQGKFDNLNDSYSGWQGQVGLNTLDGARALAFVRQRYGLPEGDIDRIRRQQHFLGAAFRKIASPDTLLNPAKVTGVLDAVTSALTLDSGTSLADLRLLAVRMQGIDSGGVAFETVPTTPETIGGQAALVARPDEFAALLARRLPGRRERRPAGRRRRRRLRPIRSAGRAGGAGGCGGPGTGQPGAGSAAGGGGSAGGGRPGCVNGCGVDGCGVDGCGVARHRVGWYRGRY